MHARMRTAAQVAEEVETQLQRYRAAVEEINKKTAAGAQEGAFDPDELLRKNTQNLMHAVSSLPELQEQKKVRAVRACVGERGTRAWMLQGGIVLPSPSRDHNPGQPLHGCVGGCMLQHAWGAGLAFVAWCLHRRPRFLRPP